MNTITIKFKETDLVFKATQTVLDELKIKSTVEDIIGADNLINIEENMGASLRLYQEEARQELGEQQFDELTEKERDGNISEEERAILYKTRDNRHYRKFFRYVLDRQFLFDLAWLKVMCTVEYDFFSLTTEEVNGLIQEVKKATAFFREQAK